MVGPVEPYLKYGVICEKVLAEKDNVLSLIRIVDRFTLTITDKEPPEKIPELTRLMTIAMCWVGGLGTHEASFSIQSPGGEIQHSPQSWSFTLDALIRSHTIATQIPVQLKKDGTYWIQFILNGVVKSRIPFQLIYEKQKIS
jgi:hypothetical protein